MGAETKYTIVARPPQDSPTQEQLRVMMRGFLEERFALKAHRENHPGTINSLIVAKPGMTGPGLKLHEASQICVNRVSGGTPEPGKPDPVFCGLELHQAADGMLHVSMIDVTLPEACTLFGGLAGVLGGRGMDEVADGTGLQGKWDIRMAFLPERNGPTGDALSGNDVSGPSFTSALEKQLGLRLKKGAGQVESLIVDNITPPAVD